MNGICSRLTSKETRRSHKLINIFSALLYAICGVAIAVNFYVLMNRNDTIYYLRLYHLVSTVSFSASSSDYSQFRFQAVGALMITCSVMMILFMWRASRQAFPKLKSAHTIPRPTLVSAFVLTAGIALGYAYFLVFNIAFSNCDKLIDATNSDEQWQDAIYSALMIIFCLLAFVYILQRSYYGSFHDSNLDTLTRRWVNVVLTIVWIKIVIFKGYLSYQELCQRKELSGYWCPIIKRPYLCNPEAQIKGTQVLPFIAGVARILGNPRFRKSGTTFISCYWPRGFIPNFVKLKGLLNSTVISCASEFFPVMLVAHWLACGRAEERADELIRKRQEKKSVRKMLQGLMVYGLVDRPTSQMSTLEIARWIKVALVILSWAGVITSIGRWFVGFYFAIRFDYLHKIGSMQDDYWEFIAALGQLLLFSLVYKWSRTVDEKRFEPHHKAEARGDLMIIFGSAAFMTVKLLLQILELNFQRADGFIALEECVIRTMSLSMIQASEWLQFLCLGRVMSLHFEDVHATKSFLPTVALCSVIINWVCFGMTFFETNIIKYQLSKPEFNFSQTTLISMIFTQTIYPADYLFMFTAAGCWTDVLLRYVEMGYFQLGEPSLSTIETDSSHNGASPEERRRRSDAHHANHANQAHSNANNHYSQAGDMRKRISDGSSPISIAIIPA